MPHTDAKSKKKMRIELIASNQAGTRLWLSQWTLFLKSHSSVNIDPKTEALLRIGKRNAQ